MAKRYVDAFDDVEDNRVAEEIEDIEATFESDDEEYESDEEERVAIVEHVPSHEARVAALNAKYANSLSECYEAVKNNLTWTSVEPANNCSSIKSIIDDEKDGFVTIKRKSSRKINKATVKPMDVEIKYGTFSGLVMKQPQETEPTLPVDRLCRYIAKGQVCPYDKKCKFSHDKKHSNSASNKQGSDKMMTAEGKTKRIWMCRSFVTTGKCRYGNDCAYAHGPDQVKAAVSTCNRGLECRRVKRTASGYVNVGESKCMRLHPKEEISNFIARTS